MEHSVKVLIDPAYVNYWPFHLIPRVLSNLPLPWFSHFEKINPKERSGVTDRLFGPEKFDGMDIDFTYTGILDSKLSVNRHVLSRYVEKTARIFAFHATYSGGSPLFSGTAMDLSAGTERERIGLKNQVLAASEIRPEGTVLVVHLGNTTDRKTGLKNAIRTLGSVLPLAEERRVVLAIENMTNSPEGEYYLGADYRDIRTVIETLASPCVRMCLDWGHANNFCRAFQCMTGPEAPRNSVPVFGYFREIVKELGAWIVHAHVHYNQSHLLKDVPPDRRHDAHMPLCRIPEEEREAFSETIRFLLGASGFRETGSITLELYPKAYFKIFRVSSSGCNLEEQLESVKILRNMINVVPG